MHRPCRSAKIALRTLERARNAVRCLERREQTGSTGGLNIEAKLPRPGESTFSAVAAPDVADAGLRGCKIDRSGNFSDSVA